MRVLLLSTNTGQGHNGAAKALQERLEELGHQAIIMDVLNSGHERSALVSKVYDGAVNHIPGIFGAVYGFAERISSDKRHSPIYYMNAMYAKQLLEKIYAHNPDMIICPHMFSAHAITRLRDKEGLEIPAIGIITDYTWSPFWEETQLDYYVVANEEVAKACQAKGMAGDKLLPLGIPVSKKFTMCQPKNEAQQIFGVSRKAVFGIMGGSMGYGRMYELAKALSQQAADSDVLVVCGKNQELFTQIATLGGNVKPLGFIDNVDVFMDAVDVLLTKPGGLSTTEALSKRIPLVITTPIPGGEERNADSLESFGVIKVSHDVEEAVSLAIELLENSAERERMLAAQQLYINRFSTNEICDFILSKQMIESSVENEKVFDVI